MRLDELFESRKPWLRITPTHLQQAKGGKAQLIVEMNATTFLEMTTTGTRGSGQVYSPIDDIRRSSQRLKKYNKWAKEGSNILMPFLTIELSEDGSGYVSGHEGRHRAAAIEREGTGIIPVAIMLRAGKNMLPDVKFGVNYHLTSEHLPAKIKGQYDNNYYDTTKWKIIQDDMQAATRRYSES